MKTPSWFLKKSVIAYLLLPLSLLYYFITKSVYFYRLFCQKSSKRPVICIGNIFAGGVGKTPIVMEIAKYLSAPVIMRGYKKIKNKNDIGDEAKMLQRAGITALVGNRLENIEFLNKEKSKTPIIMDDGFQNSSIKKDISILVFDEKLGFGNGFMLPAGPLREPSFAIKRADAIIIISSKNPNKNFKINYDLPVFYAKTRTILPKDTSRFIAFAGIAYPQKFFDALKPAAIETFSFPDHHNFSRKDLDKLFSAAKKHKSEILTTQKDWVRLPNVAVKKIKFARQEMIIEKDFYNWLSKKINDKITKGYTNGKF